jgi:4-alpha-glucanotransferase
MTTIFPRASGILMHPTSLPGRYGIGDLGEWAYTFVDWLVETGQSYWQVLPLGPTSYGDSPYQTLSAFAGNTLLISLDKLAENGWLSDDDLADVPKFPTYWVDFGPVIDYHQALLTKAYQGFRTRATESERGAYAGWCEANAGWLDDYGVFVALKNVYGGRPWTEWPAEEGLRDPLALEAARAKYAEAIDERRFLQWQFSVQWLAVKTYANRKGIRLIGDIPIFIAHDSSDVWANRDLFYLDEKGMPTVVAGVPPDYFSETGQRWGNPLYRWDKLKASGYRWWLARIKAVLEQVDIARIDHFRGFAGYWEIPASEPTAVIGQWVDGPGAGFFQVMQDELGKLPIIAEDLGVITPEVVALRDQFELPGMRILQFAWGGAAKENHFLPHNHVQNCVVYTGTHDNNTTLGWYLGGEADEGSKHYLTDYVGHDIQEPHWDMIRLGMMSVANTFVMPLQDVFGFGEDTRMNTPGKESGNWGWRVSGEWFENDARQRLAHLTRIFARWPEDQNG